MEGSPNNKFYSREAFDKAQTEEERQELIAKAEEEAKRENKDFDYSVIQKEQIGNGLSETEVRGEISEKELRGRLSSEEMDKLLKMSGANATLDKTFEDGVIKLEISDKLKEELTSWDTAEEQYEMGGYGSPWILPRIKDIKLDFIKVNNLDVVVLNCGETTPESRDKLVEEMDKIGYRPLNFSEYLALVVLRSEYTKRNESLITYEKYNLHGFSGPVTPSAFCDSRDEEENLGLSISECDENWNSNRRFLFVQK